jgi:hypothetical protein
MKFHWGHGILIALILIVITFSTALVLSFSDEKDHQLVTEDYYAKELAFQNQIDRSDNAKRAGYELSVTQNENGLSISVEGLKTAITSGSAVLMRPSDENLDLTVTLSTQGECLFEASGLRRGKYSLTVAWEEGDTPYLLEKEVFIQ